MREIKTHHTNEANKRLRLRAREDESGEPHSYAVEVLNEHGLLVGSYELYFQHGPIKEVGVNGITNEVLLAIVIDRLEYFQSGKFACEENTEALAHIRQASEWLELRTRNREARGVEGTHEV